MILLAIQTHTELVFFCYNLFLTSEKHCQHGIGVAEHNFRKICIYIRDTKLSGLYSN